MYVLTCSFQGVPEKYMKESIEFERALGTFLICMYPIMPAFSAQLWQSFRAVATHTEMEYDFVSKRKPMYDYLKLK